MPSEGLRIGSLFSGIGGFELGLEYAGLGRTVWQVELEEFCRSVLAARWPEAERFTDVHEVGKYNLAPVDLICGGFPCQDVSSAGARAGLAGERSGLWREYARIVGELRPEWVVVENVTSGAALWVDTVLRDLGQLGYATLPVPVQADALGAPYPRARIFVVARRLASAHCHGEHSGPIDGEVANAQASEGVACCARESADADGEQLRHADRRQRWADGQGEGERLDHPWQVPMPQVDGVVSGAPTRVAAQRAAGNCVVPACAEVIGWVVRALSGTHND